MNIEAYDLDSLRKIVRALQKENDALKSQLKKADIAFDALNPFEETIESINEYDPDQGERILGRYMKIYNGGFSKTIFCYVLG
ncbi:hypothetical protein [Kineothrix sedimenti]|uniref:Uncharacterized protein n=1 Tax=Kineothrix sedimenti TaxID=3123317 RepID=A0ABZ3EUH0_9FIRM